MIAVDANILLELLEQHKHMLAVRQTLDDFRQQGEAVSASALSISHIFYLAEAHNIATKRVEELTRVFKVYDVTSADIDWALGHYKGKDFEDALQIAAALREKCAAFLTLDASLARKYSKFLDIKLIGKS